MERYFDFTSVFSAKKYVFIDLKEMLKNAVFLELALVKYHLLN